MYRQVNINNVGIDRNEEIPKGYQHEDGLVFDSTHPAWVLQKDFNELSKDILMKYPTVEKILDVGSGAGNFRHGLIQHNPNILVITLDGNKETINSPLIDKKTHFIVRTDVDYEIVDVNDITVKFDLVCSFEHFEHIEPENFDVFINNIKKHSHEETILIATAANWKYPNSEVHCNVKNLAEWDYELCNKYGMEKINERILNANNWSARINHTFELQYKVYGK